MRPSIPFALSLLIASCLAGCGGGGGGSGPHGLLPIASLAEPGPASTASPVIAGGVVGSAVTSVTGSAGIHCGAGAGNLAQFGYAVSAGDLTGDGKVDLVVGVPFADVNATEISAGRVVVFFGDGSVECDRSLILESPIPRANASFGGAVLVADVTGDGAADLVVGEPSLTHDFITTAVYVYPSLGGGAFGQPLVLPAPASPSASHFGTALAAGDVTGDQITDLIVGDLSDGPSGVGAVYVYPGGGSGGFASPIKLTTPTPPPSPTSPRFGNSIAVGDVTADGKLDIVIGAPTFTGPGETGAVYVFPSDGSGAFGTPISLAPASSIERFLYGYAVAVADLNHDGAADVIVGAFLDDVGSLYTVGRVFAFLAVGGGLFAPPIAIEYPYGVEEARFGYSLSAGDVDGDGRIDLAVGAANSSAGTVRAAGTVLLFSFDDQGSPTHTHTLTRPFASADDGFGTAVCAADVTGDGLADIVVGADAVDIGGVHEAGEVYLFSLP